MRKPKTACKYFNCPKLLDHPGYCKEHRALMGYVSDNWSYLYNSRSWTKYRKVYLSKNPLCVQCKRNEKIAPSGIVDHIIPHRGSRELFWDPNNHQALCDSCHRIKTAKESGFGETIKEE